MSLAAEKRSTPGIINIRQLGKRDYEPLWREMQQFTGKRDGETRDEIWFTEHPPVFTLGLNASREHVLAPRDIPVIQVDRGGQVTYHGPGQLMIYPLIDLKRAGLGVRDLVTGLEQAAVSVAADSNIEAASRADAPGVYVAGKKIASVGIRIKRGASYHGMAFNVDLDIEPFSRINPCGFDDLEVTDLKRLGVDRSLDQVAASFERHLLRQLKLQESEVVRS